MKNVCTRFHGKDSRTDIIETVNYQNSKHWQNV